MKYVLIVVLTLVGAYTEAQFVGAKQALREIAAALQKWNVQVRRPAGTEAYKVKAGFYVRPTCVGSGACEYWALGWLDERGQFHFITRMREEELQRELRKIISNGSTAGIDL